MSARDLLLQNLGRVARCTPIPLQHATAATVKNDHSGETLAHPAEPTNVAAAPLYYGEGVARCTRIGMQHATRYSVHNASGGVRATGTATAVQRPAAVAGKAQAQRATSDVTGAQQAASPEETGCRECAHASRFQNCGKPIAAGLSERFMLIGHPNRGLGCKAFATREQT